MSQTTERFDLQTRLAAGNAGLVYRGVEKATRRRVALKLLIDTGLPHPLDGDALFRDAARVRRTAGNNIAQLLDVIPDEDVGMVLVYEYADGPNWTDAAANRRLDGAQAVDVAAQLLSAIAVGEAIKVPHGEIKPANLILGELPSQRLFVWVLDWGLARYRPEPPADALIWMSPERLAGAPASAEGDLFAMGACLCWLLTGTVPITGETREELAAAWQRFPANALAQVRPDLPAKFTRWVGTLLDPNPRGRFPTTAAARQALAALDPPAPPILPEIFRPRPKSPLSGIVPRSVPVTRVAAVPKARAVIEETLPVIPEQIPAPGENEPLVEDAAAPDEESGEPELVAENADPWPLETAAGDDLATTPSPELPPEDFPTTEPELPPADDPAPPPAPATAANRSGLWLAILIFCAALGAGAWFYQHRPGGDATTGGPVETVLHRDLTARPALAPNGKGGEWFYSFKLAHFPTTARAGVYELQANVFSETAMDEVIRLSFSETAGRLTVVSFPARGSATLPGPAHVPQPLLIRCQATPAGPGRFNVTLDLWANPTLAALGPPAFSAAASKISLPNRIGVLFQKKPTLTATTTVIEGLVIGKTAAEVLK
ncbi:MAG: protein kinase [Chthoniobacter sp.]|nr:protein kinase [Chthoniobacter sp.]